VAPPAPDFRALDALRRADPSLAPVVDSLEAASRSIVTVLASGGTVFLAGNGGSMADALHIAGELKKSFERPRPLPDALAARLVASGFEGGTELAAGLEAGLRVTVLGADPVLATAVDNDLAPRHLVFAQELVALGRPGDALVVLTTSGRSPNVIRAAELARCLDMTVVALTGADPSASLVAVADHVVRAPASGTADVQGWHSRLYHSLCRVVEDSFFPDPQGGSAGSAPAQP
jgi:D-sedoheptulose 7-phosphate isomerase